MLQLIVVQLVMMSYIKLLISLVRTVLEEVNHAKTNAKKLPVLFSYGGGFNLPHPGRRGHNIPSETLLH